MAHNVLNDSRTVSSVLLFLSVATRQTKSNIFDGSKLGNAIRDIGSITYNNNNNPREELLTSNTVTSKMLTSILF